MAGRDLVIVESPAKAGTINKYLGNGFIVKASIGHIRDLPSGKTDTKPEKDSKVPAAVRRMGINPDDDWRANYQIIPGKEKHVAELKRLAAASKVIYLATDMDREGEAIAWHLQELIGGDPSRFKRVVFNQITKGAIQKAFDNPGVLDINMVNAQQTRRFLDRMVGYMVSPVLWAKVARGLSAGRVQSVAVKIIVEREKEIRAFIPDEFWKVFIDTKTQFKQSLRLELVKQAGKTIEIPNQAAVDHVLSVINSNPQNIKVVGNETKPTTSRPSAPFITSSLQQAASSRLGYGVKKTMTTAQKLYEAGHITYMRTDSAALSPEALAMVRPYIKNTFGDRYLPEKPNYFGNKEGAQEAHEAIRPTDVYLTPDRFNDQDGKKLYELIWRRFVASQMPPAIYNSSTILASVEDLVFSAKGRTLVFDGHVKVMGVTDDGDVILPQVAIGEPLSLSKVVPEQHYTKPPARYSEAALVKELEKKGIGRPSTYASIITTIQDRGYVKIENKRFYAEKIGEIVTDRLSKSIKDLMDYDFTALLEAKLDKIAEGSVHWKDALSEFYRDLKTSLDDASNNMEPNDPTEVSSIACLKCSRPMSIRTGATGVFLGCTGYNLPPKEKCKGTINLTPDAKIKLDNDGYESTGERKRCPICDTGMEAYVVDRGRKLHICGNNPNCSGHLIEEGTFKITKVDVPTTPCDKCDRQMELKAGRFGSYYGCECGNTRKMAKDGSPAPVREAPIHLKDVRSKKYDDYFVLREGGAGLFLAASKYPKVREARAPLVSEIRTVKDQLSAKYQYLLDAPDNDPEGNPYVLKFDRKTQAQYVGSECDGKPTKFSLQWTGTRWTMKS